jgi:hypothetical protein
MSSVAVETTIASPVNPRSRVILASLIGTTVEFYDFYVYATAAVLVFPHLSSRLAMTEQRCWRRSPFSAPP